MKTYYLPIVVFAVIIFLTFKILLSTFFQQDEWQAFGENIYLISLPGESILKTIFFITGTISHFNPLATLLFRFEYFVFGVNFSPYAWLAIGFHFINTLLFFYFALLLFEKKSLALVASLLFSVNSFSHQAVSWVAAGAGLLQATTFLLLALIFFQKSIFLSLAFLFIALLFKETPLFLLFFLPLWRLALAKERNLRQVKKIATPFLIFGLVYFFFRLIPLLGNFNLPEMEVVDITPPPPLALFYRLLTVPLKALTQVFFPASWLLDWSERLVFLAYPWFVGADKAVNPYVSQTIVSDLLSYFLAFLILGLIWFLRRAKILIFGLAFVLAGSLPFILIPGKGGYFSIFEPRNLYILGIGSALMITSLLTKYPKLLFIFLIPFLAFHFSNIQKDLKKIQSLGQLRKSFLVQIQKSYPALPKKVIFYTESDAAYYGLPIEEKILPVQSGFGRMLMIWYQEKEVFPGCLYEQQFLHDLVSQGYRECQGRGFGYFREYEKMVKTVRESRIGVESVFAFSWQGETEELKDITSQIREKLKNEKN